MPVEDDFTGCRAAFLTREAGSGVKISILEVKGIKMKKKFLKERSAIKGTSPGTTAFGALRDRFNGCRLH